MGIKIYQVELTNRCNATCHYCPHQRMSRPYGDMSLDTFIRVVAHFPNKYMALHHFGEPMLHSHLEEAICISHKYDWKVEFSTNGGTLKNLQEVLNAKPYRMRVAYDFFKPDAFLRTALAYNKSTIITAHSVDGKLPGLQKPFNNFAGAVEGETCVKGECYFKKYGFVCVLWTGEVVPCCQDYNGQNIIGHVRYPSAIEHKETYPMCEKCGGMQFAEDGLWKEDIGK